MTALLYPFIVLAATGFVLSFVVHLASLIGLPIPRAAMGLHIGIFVVWLPTILVSRQLTRDFKQKDLWKAIYVVAFATALNMGAGAVTSP